MHFILGLKWRGPCDQILMQRSREKRKQCRTKTFSAQEVQQSQRKLTTLCMQSALSCITAPYGPTRITFLVLEYGATQNITPLFGSSLTQAKGSIRFLAISWYCMVRFDSFNRGFNVRQKTDARCCCCCCSIMPASSLTPSWSVLCQHL